MVAEMEEGFPGAAEAAGAARAAGPLQPQPRKLVIQQQIGAGGFGVVHRGACMRMHGTTAK